MSFRLAVLVLAVCAVGYGQANLGSFGRSARSSRYGWVEPAWRYTPPDCSATAEAPPNAADAGPQDFVELERSLCFGGCYAYRVRLYRNGEVEWQSHYMVQTGEISKGTADPVESAALLDRAYADEFWSACESYPGGEDSPTYSVTVGMGDRRRAIEFGERFGPDWLNEFARDLDRAVDTHRWFHGDPATEDLDHISREIGLSKRSLTPLMRAAATDDTARIAELLADGALIDETDASGWTALMYAAGSYAENAVAELLVAGANAHHTDLVGRTPLMASAYGDGFKALLAAAQNGNLQSQHRVSALMVLARRANAEMIDAALAAGADPTLVDANGRTAWDYLMQSYCGRVLSPEEPGRLPQPSDEEIQQCVQMDRVLSSAR